MGREHINIGTLPNDGTGDSLRVAGGKINEMTAELYNIIGVISLDLELSDSLYRFTEFTYNVSGDISNKSIYTDNTKVTKIYNIDFTYNVGGDLINTETTRISDNFVFNKELEYDVDGNVINKNII